MSTTIFKLVTYKIIEYLEKKGIKYEIEGKNFNSLFFADDGMLFAKSKEEAERNLEILIEIGKEYGLYVNKEKSKVLIYGGKENCKEVGGIEVVQNLKYLGLIINNERDIYRLQKEKIEKEMKKYELLTYSTLSKCCNRMIIGKMYWKGVVLPTVLHGVGLMNIDGKKIEKLQSIEYGVYREILGALQDTVVEVLRGEIGVSLIETKIIQSRLLLVRSIWNGKNEWVKDILKELRGEKNNQWNKVLNRYLGKIGVQFEELVEMSKEEIKKKVQEKDNKKWKEGLEKKTSAIIYKEYKKK